ncbi:unnamed protein product, partial [Amoebophrya sp. A120]
FPVGPTSWFDSRCCFKSFRVRLPECSQNDGRGVRTPNDLLDSRRRAKMEKGLRVARHDMAP